MIDINANIKDRGEKIGLEISWEATEPTTDAEERLAAIVIWALNEVTKGMKSPIDEGVDLMDVK